MMRLTKYFPRVYPRHLGHFLKCAVLIALPMTTFGFSGPPVGTTTNVTVSTSLTWNPSPDPSVAGYNIYYGITNGIYTNMVSVGNVTNTTIQNLEPNMVYYFVAKAYDDAGNESLPSNEAAFANENGTPLENLSLATMPSGLGNDQVTFSLASGAPPSVSINPTTGVLSWNLGLTNASSTNAVTVIVTDLTNPSASMEEAQVITVSDYLGLTATSVPVQTGQTASLPLTAISSVGMTNLVFTVNWPGNQLLNPTLIFNAPVSGGTLVNQGTNLVINVWTANGEMLTGTNQFAQINFQDAIGKTSAFYELPVSSLSANKAGGSTFVTAEPGSGEVVAIGAYPLLRSQFNASQGRSLTLYANPGLNYQLQYSTNYLTSAAQWQTLQNYQPNGIEGTVNLNSANPIVFYRLMQD
jgi:hypothetical protein